MQIIFMNRAEVHVASPVASHSCTFWLGGAEMKYSFLKPMFVAYLSEMLYQWNSAASAILHPISFNPEDYILY